MEEIYNLSSVIEHVSGIVPQVVSLMFVSVPLTTARTASYLGL